MKAIRGATSVESDDAQEIRERVVELMSEIFARNDMGELHSVIFTITKDITALNPATAFRKAFDLGEVALLCLYEAAFENSPRGIVRVLIHCESSTKNFVYLRRAKDLRPDLAKPKEDGPK